MWAKQEIKSVLEYMELVLSNEDMEAMIYRGQANTSWPLIPKLYRESAKHGFDDPQPSKSCFLSISWKKLGLLENG